MTLLMLSLILAGAVAIVGAVLALTHRAQVRTLLAMARALATDPRIPRPVRLLIVLGLATKAMPVDFGIDELALGLAALLLVGPYRQRARAVLADARAGAAVPSPA